jgi:hypothetical protein
VKRNDLALGADEDWSHTCVLLLFVAYFFMESMTAAVDWENSTITLRGGMRGASRGRARQRAESRRARENRDAKQEKYLRVDTFRIYLSNVPGDVADDLGEVAGGDQVGLARVNGSAGAVVVVDLHGAALEEAEVVRGARLGASGKKRGHGFHPVEPGVQGDLHGRLVADVHDVGGGEAHFLLGAGGVVKDGHVAVGMWSARVRMRACRD